MRDTRASEYIKTAFRAVLGGVGAVFANDSASPRQMFVGYEICNLIIHMPVRTTVIITEAYSCFRLTSGRTYFVATITSDPTRTMSSHVECA